MEILILLLLLASSANNFPLNRTKRMMGADKCNITKHPSMVSITSSSYSSYTNITTYRYGTGVLITMKWLLTFDEVFLAGDYSESKVVAGSNYELPSETVQVREIERTMKIGDLVLAELEKPFEESASIQKAKIPNKANFVNGCKKLTAVGWGQKKTSSYSIHTKELTVRKEFGDLLECGEANYIRCYNNPIKICFEMEGAIGFCGCDYGFGVFCEDMLVGITDSYAWNDCRTYSSNLVNRAYNISDYMDWLHKNTGIEIPSKFYQNVTTPDTYKPGARRRRTTEKYKKKSQSTSTTEENTEILSNSHPVRPIPFIYPLLVCLRLIL